MQNTFVSMFHRRSVLNETLAWLREHGYDVRTADLSQTHGLPDVLAALGELLDFPAHYNGLSLDAFNDCLSDVASGATAPASKATGLVVVLAAYDQLVHHDLAAAQAILDIFATQARYATLFGHRMMCLVQSNDPALSFTPVGATPVEWNDQEWMDSAGGLSGDGPPQSM